MKNQQRIGTIKTVGDIANNLLEQIEMEHTQRISYIATQEELYNILRLVESENTRELGLQQAKTFNVDPAKIVSHLLTVGFNVLFFEAGQLTHGGGDNSTLGGETIRVGNYLNVTIVKAIDGDQEKMIFNNLYNMSLVQELIDNLL